MRGQQKQETGLVQFQGFCVMTKAESQLFGTQKKDYLEQLVQPVPLEQQEQPVQPDLPAQPVRHAQQDQHVLPEVGLI
jgi:hypothetical protein